ncbi:MAG: PilZ domain-containing protein [Pseudomonadota bacterium]
MEHSAINACAESEPAEDEVVNADRGADQRAAPRFTLLIKAARLVAAQGEFVCVIRDISETGISVRLFHACPSGDSFELQMPNGGSYEIQRVWARGQEAGFTFAKPLNVEKLINEAGEYPKRGLRLGVCFPISINSLTYSGEAIVENLSQQGARFECEERLAIQQNLRIKGGEGAEEFREVRAKVRWRRDSQYGVVFEDTLSLGDFARLAARLQAPALLDD